ncbi:copper chaperone PCu(A)C [Streptomyces sp. YIM S03343]
MSSSLRRGALAASVIAFSVASLAACGAGNNSQTLQITPDNAATTVGTIKIQNATVITQPDGGASGGPAVISATLFNTGTTAQTLDSVAVDGDGSAELSPAGGKGKVTVPAGGSVILGGKGNAAAALASPGANVQDGNAQKVTFTFSETGAVSLRAFVVPAESYFTKWGPSTIPTPTATATATATRTATPAGSATGSASPGTTASGSATATATASGQ